MKKVLLIVAITILGLVKVQAQDVEFGVKVGVNFSSIHGDVDDDIEPITSIINYGIYSEIGIFRDVFFSTRNYVFHARF